VILAAVMEKLLAGENDQAQALLVQGLKATHQCALHGGAWDKGAWHLTGLPDPLGHEQFAGTHAEMAATASYMKAVDELNARVGRQNTGPDREEQGEGTTRSQRRAAAKAKAGEGG